MGEDEVWESALRELVRDWDREDERLERDLNRIRDRHSTVVEKLRKRASNLHARREDPVVIYAKRYAGPAPKYHDSASPCGQGRRIEYPQRLLLGDARERGIKPCAFCGPRPSRG